VVNSVVSEHLEVLRVPLRGRIGIRLVKGVDHADAFDGLLFDPIDHVGRLNAGGFEDGRNDVDDVVELRAKAAHIYVRARRWQGLAGFRRSIP
jgi:hypothetical protein